MKVYIYASELFWDSMPQYLAIGMSSEEFWHGQPKLAVAYREAERIRRDNRFHAEWREGIYTLQALLAAAPALKAFTKADEHEYPKEPVFSTSTKAVTEEDRQKAQMEKAKTAFVEMANKLNAKLAERGATQGEQ